MIWQLTSHGTYSTQSLYKIINFRVVIHVHTLLCGKLRSLPEFIFFLWLVSRYRIRTKDNVSKRGRIDDDTCVFCCEKEIVHHLLFDYVVANSIGLEIAEELHVNVLNSFEKCASLWL